jgi:hypothetical protein
MMKKPMTSAPGKAPKAMRPTKKMKNGGNVKKTGSGVKKTGSDVKKTTRTPDGGQQYVRNNNYKVAGAVADRLSGASATAGDFTKTFNPKAARIAGEAAGYALSPGDKGLAERSGKLGETLANSLNQNRRDYGNKTRR